MLQQITDDLIADLDGMVFAPPVTHVYNPLLYARASWDMYCAKYGQGSREIVWVGMNPGPWGMSQVGVPFGEIEHVRDWLGVEAPVGKPDHEHPKRPVEGFACGRSEVSGRRLWGWAKATYGTPEAFFARFFVWNYCPLAFMEESGRNRIPEKLPKAERDPLFAACDKALRGMIEHFEPKFVIGVGKFAEKRAKRAVKALGLTGEVTVGAIPHPSPASPLANKGWAKLVAPALAGRGWRCRRHWRQMKGWRAEMTGSPGAGLVPARCALWTGGPVARYGVATARDRSNTDVARVSRTNRTRSGGALSFELSFKLGG